MTQRQRREPEPPKAEVALNELAKALSDLLPGVLKEFDVEIGAALDEVVVRVKPEDVPSVCRILMDNPELDFNYLRCLSVVDYVERLEVVYHLFSMETQHKLVLKTSVPPDEPIVPSIVSLWRGADWFEREGHDLFGVVFQGHPNLSPLLLYEGFEGYPGRKSYPLHDYQEW